MNYHQNKFCLSQNTRFKTKFEIQIYYFYNQQIYRGYELFSANITTKAPRNKYLFPSY